MFNDSDDPSFLSHCAIVEDLHLQIKLLKQKSSELLRALELVKLFHDNLFEKGNVDWGRTFGLDFGLMNETLLKIDNTLVKWRDENA